MNCCGHYFTIFTPDYSNTFTENFVEMPNGWQACDGSIIEEGIWTGQPTPDLTTDKRFLRGGTMEDVLMFVLQNHDFLNFLRYLDISKFPTTV